MALRHLHLSLLCLLLSAAQSVTASDEVLRLRFDKPSQTLVDASGAVVGHLGKTPKPGADDPAWVAEGRSGGALSFDGKDDCAILKDLPALRFGPGKSFTIELWAKPLGEDRRRRASIMARRAARSKAYWAFRLSTKGRLGFVSRNAKGARDISILSPRNSLGKWAHLAFVRDAKDGMARYYWNGKLVREVKDPTTPDQFGGPGRISIGGTAGGWPFYGLVDEIVFYDGVKRSFGDAPAAGGAQGPPPPYRPAEAKVEKPDAHIAASWDELDKLGLAIVPAPKRFRPTGEAVPVDAKWSLVAKTRGLDAGLREINLRLAELGAKPLPVRAAAKGNRIAVGVFDDLKPELARIGSPARPRRQGYVIDFVDGKDGALVVVAGADLDGARYGCVTLSRMLKPGPVLVRARVVDWPDYKRRMGMSLTGRVRTTSLPYLKGRVDEAFRAKLNYVWGKTYYISFEKLVEYNASRRILNAYAAARGIRIVIGRPLDVGKAPYPKGKSVFNPQGYAYKTDEGLVGHRGRAYTWSRDDLLDARGEVYAKFMRDTGSNAFYVHAMDTGGRDNPENWNLRTPMDRKRFGDDRGAADANVVNRFRAKMRAADPTMDLFFVAYPYSGTYLHYPDLRAWMRSLSARAPEDVFFCVRESSRANMKLWKQSNRQGMFVYHNPFTSGLGLTFHTAGRYARTFHFDDRDVYWMLTRSPPAVWVAAEYAWNTEAPGWGWMPAEYNQVPYADSSPEVIDRRLTPRVCAILYGERAADDVSRALLAKLSLRLASDPKYFSGANPEAYFRAKAAAAVEAVKRLDAAKPKVKPAARDRYARLRAEFALAARLNEARYRYYEARRELVAERFDEARRAIGKARKALAGIPPKSHLVKPLLKDMDIAAGIKWRRERKEYVRQSKAKPFRVGVYRRGGPFGKGVLDSFSGLQPTVTVGSFDDPTTRILAQYDVIVFPAARDMWDMTEDWRVTVKRFVEQGGGVIFSHNSVGRYPSSAFAKPLFPNICAGYGGRVVDRPDLTAVREHPSTGGLKSGARTRHVYTDHLYVRPGPKGIVVLKDRAGKAVMVVGDIGRGHVAYTGQIFGYTAASQFRESTGEEWRLLYNITRWAAGR